MGFGNRPEIYYCLFMNFHRFQLHLVRQFFRRFWPRDPIEVAREKLPHKSQQVLELIIEARPPHISRDKIIDYCWDGNILIGEKGLNHALWNIRRALSDNARNPHFIQTISRKGYRWIGPAKRPKRSNYRFKRYGPAVTILVLLIGSASLTSNKGPIEIAEASAFKAPDGRSTAYFKGNDIIVERASAISLIMKPTGKKHFGRPSYSRDSQELAFPVYNSGECELIVVRLNEVSYKKFENCPT